MTIKIELGFTPLGTAAPFFTLDDAVKGVLDSPTYVLGGEVLADISQYARQVRITRGKSRELDRFRAGSASVAFNNNERVFDPSYTLSPYYGQIQPKRRLRVTVDNVVQFDGTVDDWDVSYEPGGYSLAVANATDAIQNLANLSLNDFAPTNELSGARVNSVLDEISWEPTRRDIDLGSVTLTGGTVATGTNAFTYLQTVSQSEPGDLFISKDGKVAFVDRYAPITGSTPYFSDDGQEIGYERISTIVGSELLYNNITVTSSAGTATAVDTNSVEIFGEIDYELETLLADSGEITNLANFLLQRYANPQYRINDITVNLKTQTTQNREAILGIDLGKIVQVSFTPSGIPPAFVTFAKVIKIDQFHSASEERVTFGLEAVAGVVLVLDAPEFGKLDSGYFLSNPYNAWTISDPIYGRLSAGMAVS